MLICLNLVDLSGVPNEEIVQRRFQIMTDKPKIEKLNFNQIPQRQSSPELSHPKVKTKKKAKVGMIL